MYPAVFFPTESKSTKRYNERMKQLTQKSTSAQTLLPAYLVVGSDELKREAVMKRLKARISERGDLAFNCDVLSGATCTGADIVNACNTVPFASEVRLVEVREADKLKKTDANVVASYLAMPSDFSVLALVAEKLARTTKLYKAVVALGSVAVIDCAPQKRRDLVRTVCALGKSHGIALNDRAAERLIDLVGENTVRLDGEVKKIALAHEGSHPVDEGEIARIVARTAEAKPWQLVDAMSARSMRDCLSVLSRLDTSSPYALIAMCVTRIRELICAQSLDRRGAARSLSSVLRVPDWRVKNHVAWSRGFTSEELRCALIRSRDAERAMKSGADADEVFLLWLLDVVRGDRLK